MTFIKESCIPKLDLEYIYRNYDIPRCDTAIREFEDISTHSYVKCKALAAQNVQRMQVLSELVMNYLVFCGLNKAFIVNVGKDCSKIQLRII